MQLSKPHKDAELALHQLRRLVQGIRTSSHAVETKLGISGAQLFVLSELALEPGASIRRLSERTLTDPSSVSVAVKHLVDHNLVTRTQQSSDARTSSLTVSKKGSRLLARAPAPYQTWLITALSGLPPKKLRELRSALGKLVEALQLEQGAAPLFFETSTSSRSKSNRARS